MSARTHPPANAAWESVKDIPGITYRRLDHWIRKGYISCGFEGDECGSGHWRTLDGAEIRVVALMVALVTAGLTPAAAAPVARSLAVNKSAPLGNFIVSPS